MIVTQVDEQLLYRQLRTQQAGGEFDISEETESTGFFMDEGKQDTESRVHQLTGYSDSVYAEAFVEVHHYDILMKIILVNRTQKTIP